MRFPLAVTAINGKRNPHERFSSIDPRRGPAPENPALPWRKAMKAVSTKSSFSPPPHRETRKCGSASTATKRKGETVGKPWRNLYHLVEALGRSADQEKGLVIVDCATLWISNLLCGMGGKTLSVAEIEKEFEKFFQNLPGLEGNIRIISNEVGLGIVPDNLFKVVNFRDLQGTFNQNPSLPTLPAKLFF